ncbi:ABC transporter substrate-binding protein [Candidatus Parabeggiatoa sp. HSG14]|uniref:ABC transporter substrate-binding protein n=1 Tax=Candidatus Parabeggiatoa sp. HSG14 TaxID=3055593 RepID=UPI0025A9025B|nr:ABC transporter substrate-binding protein [Thiotrichales bacterium HSG14]
MTDKGNLPNKQLTLAVAPHIAWMPWYLADEENLFQQIKQTVDIQFVSANYQETIDNFLTEEVHAIAISNIDAIAQLVKREIEADVILITNESSGNEAILLPNEVDTNVHSLRGKNFALVKYSSRHYLLDRYLIRNQIPFEEINILNTREVNISQAFTKKEVYGVVTSNPNLYKLTSTTQAKTLFDSRQIPGEIFDLLVVQRETLLDYPDFAQVLLATWFSVMERLQGYKKGPTLDAMASLAKVTRQAYEKQLATISLKDSPAKALSTIRDRRTRKTMRHISYFIERHGLIGDDIFTDSWVSYPGRSPALLHFNGQPLQQLIAP